MGKNVVAFLIKHCDLLQYFSKLFFFMIFSKIIFVDFIRENTVVFLTKHFQLLKHFSSWVFFLPKLFLLVFFNIKLIENLTL